MLQCPKCKKPLQKDGNRYCCDNHHSFDIAKRGYVNLGLGNHRQTGDDKDMVPGQHFYNMDITSHYVIC